MKILGIDYGKKTIGLAIYDTDVDFIYPLKTLFKPKENIIRKSLCEISDIVKEMNVQKIVVGLPLNMDGSATKRVEVTEEFVRKLKIRIPDIDISYMDERLTTYEASNILTERNIAKQNQKKYLDELSAMIILENFKEKQNGK